LKWYFTFFELLACRVADDITPGRAVFESPMKSERSTEERASEESGPSKVLKDITMEILGR
jgi:hypothetical protein